jgi:hypothetical protein
MQAGGQDMLENLEADFPEHKRRASGAPHALDGIRVVDFSHFIAGPLATMILADMGAEVIKVEAPVRGDDARRYPPMHPQLDQGAPFVWSNRNKKSIALDLKSPQGLALARDLVCRADVLVENFSSGVMRRLGLDHETCLALNPRLVYCSVAAYSREGAFADRFGFDPIAQAESGFVSMNGYPDREGVRALSPVMDISTAMMVGNAVLGALLARERLGRGQRVEVSLFDTAVLMTGYATMQSLFTGKEPQRSGNTAPDTCPSGAFRASDRTFYINSGNDRHLPAAHGAGAGTSGRGRRCGLRHGSPAHPASGAPVRLPRRSVRAARLGALAGSHARRRRALRIGAHGGRGDPLARGARPRTRHPHPPSGARLGSERALADPLRRHAHGRSGGGPGGGAAYAGGPAGRSWPGRTADRRTGARRCLRSCSRSRSRSRAGPDGPRPGARILISTPRDRQQRRAFTTRRQP